MEKSGAAFFFSWSEAFEAGVDAVGGKGWNLSRLKRYGFMVPAGGVLAVEAYQIFMQENDLPEIAAELARSVTIDNIGSKETGEKLDRIREKIKTGRISLRIREELTARLKNAGLYEKLLAVRSSATAEDAAGASFAGVHESFLNVRGLDNILTAVKGCYASLWTTRAVAYRRKKSIRDDTVIPAVVIMEMVEAESAGVGFTCDPRTGREDTILVSANFGLGESVVNGVVEPDEYRLHPGYWPELAEKTIGCKKGMTVPGKQGGTEFVQPAESMVGQVLSDENIVKLGFLMLRVFEALGRGEQHQDIEWVFDGNEFILVQARPVTALPRYTCAEIKEQPDIWSNVNFRDAIPFVQSALNWSIYKAGFAGMLQSPFQSVGYRIPPGLCYVRLYQGRAYLNLSLQQWLWYDALGLAPRKTNDSLGGNQPEIKINEKKPYAGIRGLKRTGRLLKFLLAIPKSRRRAGKSFARYDNYTGDLLKQDFKSFTNEQFIRAFTANAKISTEFAAVFFFLGVSSAVTHTMLVNTLEKYFPGRGNAMANAIMAGSADITSAQHGYRLVEMAETARGDADARRFFAAAPFNSLLWEQELPDHSPFKQSLRNFLAEFGHRGVYECDLSNPRWREDPSYLLHIVRDTMDTADSGAIKARQKEKADLAWREIDQKLPFYRRMRVKSLWKQALRGAELRELAKSVIIKLYEPGRMIYQEIGRRLAEIGIIEKQNDIYHCTLIEIFSVLQGYWDGTGLTALVAGRKAGMEEMEALSPPDLIIDEAPRFAESTGLSRDNALAGMGVAAGRASGAARLIQHPNEGEKLLAGDVLVAPSTDPAWTPLFLKASAIVMESGGVLSHGSIVAREYGIPAVVNIPGVMKVIGDHRLVTVDGDEGKVYL